MPAPVWPPRGYRTLSQAARDLGISRARIYQLVAARQIATYPTDRGALISDAAVDRLRIRKPGAPKGNRNARRHK